MKKKIERNIKSIAFIVVGSVLLISYMMVIGNYQTILFRVNKYKILLNNSEGLFNSGYAAVNGLRAGNITDITLEGDKVLVTIAIKKKYAHFINQSSLAYVKGSGVLGDKYIYIETKEEAPILPNHSFIKTKDDSDIGSDIASDIQKLVHEVNLFVQELNKEGEQNLAQELKNISNQIQTLLSDKNNQSIQKILTHFGSILQKIDNGQGTLGALINNQELHNKAVSFLGQDSYSNIMKLLLRRKKKPQENEN